MSSSPSPSVPSALILDWGGVLIDDPAEEMLRECAKTLGVSIDAYRPLNGIFGKLHDTGKLTEQEYWQAVCEKLGVAIPEEPSLWGRAFRAHYRPHQDLFAVVRQLHDRGVMTALLSNTEPAAMQHFLAQEYSQFDVLVFSCAEGMRKPGPEIYHLTLGRLGIQAGQAVFVDDKPENIETARSLGMCGIICEEYRKAMEEIQHIFKTERRS